MPSRLLHRFVSVFIFSRRLPETRRPGPPSKIEKKKKVMGSPQCALRPSHKGESWHGGVI